MMVLYRWYKNYGQKVCLTESLLHKADNTASNSWDQFMKDLVYDSTYNSWQENYSFDSRLWSWIYQWRF